MQDPTNVDAVDVTIAPGIDPLLMVCYLASHSKMDVEPIMGGFKKVLSYTFMFA